jgi:hypothetical protein
MDSNSTQLSGIKAKTDQLTFTTANKVDASAEVTGVDVDEQAIATAVVAALGDDVEVEVIASGTVAGNLDIFRADTYANAQTSGRKLTFTKSGTETHWPDTISTVHLNIVPRRCTLNDTPDAASLTDIAGTVTSNSVVYFELTGAQTDDLTSGANAYRFTVVANKDTSQATLRSGMCTVRPDASVSA